MNSQNKSFAKKVVNFVLVLSVASGATLGLAKPARAGGPQEMVINMGMDFVKSVGGKILMQQLFPEKGFDYDRIRKDMEEVTRTVITDAMITEAFAKIDAAGINARNVLYRDDAVDVLDQVRRQLVVDYAITGKGMFRWAGLGNNIQGTQTELSILAAMNEQIRLGKKGACSQACVANILKDRLVSQIKYVTDTRTEIMTKNTNDLMSKVGGCWQKYNDIQCGRMGCWTTARYYVFEDKGANYESPRFKDDMNACNRAQAKYVPERKASIVKDQENKLGWVADTVKQWQGALDIILK